MATWRSLGVDFDAPEQHLLGWWRIRRLVLGCRVSTKWVSRHQRMGCVVFHGEESGTIETSLTKQPRRIVEATDDDSNEDRERLSFWQKHTERVQLRVQTHNRGMVLGLEVNVSCVLPGSLEWKMESRRCENILLAGSRDTIGVRDNRSPPPLQLVNTRYT